MNHIQHLNDLHNIMKVKKTAQLVGTVAASRQKITAYEAQGDTNRAGLEADRLNAASDVLRARGYDDPQGALALNGSAAVAAGLVDVSALVAWVVLK